MEISVWNMEDAGMEWKISRMERKTIFHTSIKFHTKFRALYLQKHIYGQQVVIHNMVTEVLNFNIYAYYL